MVAITTSTDPLAGIRTSTTGAGVADPSTDTDTSSAAGSAGNASSASTTSAASAAASAAGTRPTTTTRTANNAAGVSTTGAAAVSAGVGVSGGQVPDASPAGVASYAALMKSLSDLMPALSNEDSTVKLVEVTTLMKQLIDSSEKDRISVDQEKQRTAIGDKTAKLKEASEKIEESRRMRESGSIWDKIKLAFMAIAAFFMTLVGTLLAATGFLVGVGVSMIAAGVLSLVMLVDTGVKMSTGLGIAGNIAKAIDPDNPAAWANADMAFSIVVAVGGLAASALTFMFTGPTEILSMAQAVMSVAMAATTELNALLGTATALGDVAAGAHRYVASQRESEGKELRAQGKEMQALLAQLDDVIDQALARLMAVSEQFSAMLDSLTDGLQDTNNSLTRARFSA